MEISIGVGRSIVEYEFSANSTDILALPLVQTGKAWLEKCNYILKYSI